MDGAKVDLTVGEETKLTIKSDSVNMSTMVNSDYEVLNNKPSIEGNVLIGDKTFEQLGLNADSLGIQPEDIGLDSADVYDIYSLFHS